VFIEPGIVRSYVTIISPDSIVFVDGTKPAPEYPLTDNSVAKAQAGIKVDVTFIILKSIVFEIKDYLSNFFIYFDSVI